MDRIKPHCASCRERIHTAWRVTNGPVYVICAQPSCLAWAHYQGLSIVQQGLVPVQKTPRRPQLPVERRVSRVPRGPRSIGPCDQCGGPLPRRPADRWPGGGGRSYCTLTCLQRAS